MQTSQPAEDNAYSDWMDYSPHVFLMYLVNALKEQLDTIQTASDLIKMYKTTTLLETKGGEVDLVEYVSVASGRAMQLLDFAAQYADKIAQDSSGE